MTDEHRALAIVPRNLDEVRALGAILGKSNLLSPDLRGKEADVVVSILAGLELGMTPMAALRGVHVVKGKPVLAADSMVGVVLGRGIAEYFMCVEESNTSVTYETKRAGAPKPQRATWTIEDAQRAGLGGGDNWKKYPRAMLKARCKAALARDVYPDVLAGCYDDDEARDFNPKREEATDAEIVTNQTTTEVLPAPAPPDPREDASSASQQGSATAPGPAPSTEDEDEALRKALVAIREAKDKSQLEALAPMLQRLDAAAKAVAREAYKSRKIVLIATESAS